MAGVYLEVLSGTGRDGEILRLAGRSFLIGRGNGCEVRVDSDISSREHAVLALQGDAWFIRDRDSRNGTFLNGKRIAEAALRPLDEIVVGKSGPVLRVVTMDPAPPIRDDGEDPTRKIRIHGSRPAQAPPPPAADDPATPRPPPAVDHPATPRPPPAVDHPATPRPPPAVDHPATPRPPPVPPSFREPTDDDGIPLVAPLPGPSAPSRPPPPAPPRGKPRRMPPILALLGLGFAASVAMGVYGPGFPYEPATAPILWCMAALRYVAPDAIPDPGVQLWVFRGLLMLYGLVAGIVLQRPIRRVVWLVALAGLHVLAVLAL